MTRCEDWPCCGHGNDCPDRDSKGNEVWRCVDCGRKLPKGAPSSICPRCQRRMHRRIESGDFDHDESMNY